jgi:hypothetical protein
LISPTTVRFGGSLLDRIEEQQKVEGQIQLSTNPTSLDLLQAIYRDPTQPIQRRMKAAAEALPFEHPKLGTIAQLRENELAEQLMRALQASQQVIEGRKMMKVIEHVPQQVSEPDAVSDHSKPFAQNSKHRFRRF